MAKLFNSTFENELRIGILLDVFDSPQNIDMLYAADFITAYGKTFGIAETDLNGDNQFKYSEFTIRRGLVQKALKELVLDGLVIPEHLNNGIFYRISPAGKEYFASLESPYSKEYRTVATKVTQMVNNKSERTVIAAINKMSAQSARKGTRR